MSDPVTAQPPAPPRPGSVFVADDEAADAVSVRGLILTAGLLAAVLGGSWLLIILRSEGVLPGLQESWIVAAAIAASGIVSFFGVYASVRRVRTALAAGLFFSWLLLSSYAFSIDGLDDLFAGRKEFWEALRTFMTAAISFYFGSEALIQSVKVYQAGKIASETIRRTGYAPDPAGVRAALSVDTERIRRR